MFAIENEDLKISISPKGAELQSIFNKQTGLEYMWGGDPAFWGKKSPILFPIVGTLKEGIYYYNNKHYSLSRHGFARDMEFEALSPQSHSLSFLLKSNEATLQHFPFEFELRIIYSIQQNSLRVSYHVKNVSDREMFFSIGGHPAFRLPLVPGSAYDDYYLEFNEEETKPRWPISKEGLITTEPVLLLQETNILHLSRQLFSDDAVVLKNLASSIVSLKTGKSKHGLDFDFGDFPYLGLWAAKNADFICIEPWCGIADSIDASQELTDKEGINKLNREEVFKRSWIATFY
ncbi:MAG: aldose 1-epimerase family protein [Bacteroidetes bacterium]|nr:aldose 1-epimerase family protein [Bacteroidota bacterium]